MSETQKRKQLRQKILKGETKKWVLFGLESDLIHQWLWGKKNLGGLCIHERKCVCERVSVSVVKWRNWKRWENESGS